MQLNKKGFVLMETIIVMTVLSIALIYLYTTYVKVLGSASKISYYDNVEDMYTAYYASRLYDKITNEEISLNSEIITNLDIVNIIYLSKDDILGLNNTNILNYDGSTINYIRSIENEVKNTIASKTCNVPCLTIVKIKRNNNHSKQNERIIDNLVGR